ncbi:lytic transglycosylase domain-containing protein [Paractinoplanes lichenicola]|uniref:Lytic transglycosylase domain-containing protein n=1 Tax=Paractinoplanes lichenicola TaxID=2802976 RepID=A0ABS1W1L1_9ACTN|nr:lytic transglycosylase domain-containing protein [Actinoplanes lichenicola]MBL7260629.1 lytic transglycosylase domain-containing protein [Actinoplanes lichenicola]
MGRLWSRMSVRAVSVGLLVAGLVGGIYLGRDWQSEPTKASFVDASQADLDMRLLKQHQSENAAARAWQREAEGAAAAKAATAAKAAAGRAHKLEQKVAADKKAAADREKEEAKGPVPYSGPIPSSCNEYSGSREIGCALMLAKGFPIAEFPCLDKLWKHESGWNYKAENKSSGAYGIPQALPGKKMASAGADWKTNPATQIKWGLGYVKGRYDTPCGAWGYFQNNGHY